MNRSMTLAFRVHKSEVDRSASVAQNCFGWWISMIAMDLLNNFNLLH